MKYKPTKPILGANYVTAINTDLAKTFARERKRLADEAKREQENQHERIFKVRSIK